MSADQRRYPRLQRPVDGAWDSESDRGHVRITNLSLGGCFVDGLGTPGIGERVAVELRFEGVPAFTVIGEVVRLGSPRGFAVYFVDVPFGGRMRLAQGLQSHGIAHPYGDSRKAPEGGEWTKVME